MKLFQKIGECPEALVLKCLQENLQGHFSDLQGGISPKKNVSPMDLLTSAQIQDGLYTKRPGTIETSLFFNGKMDGFGIWMGFQAGPKAKKQGFEVISSCTASWWLLLLLQISEPTNRTSMRQFCRKFFFGMQDGVKTLYVGLCRGGGGEV